MEKIDCTAVPEAVSDYAFDHLEDRLGEDEWEAITVDYETQTVTIHTPFYETYSDEQNPEPQEFEHFLRSIISSYCLEKTNHMKQDAADDRVNTPYTVTEMDTVRTNIFEGCILLSDN